VECDDSSGGHTVLDCLFNLVTPSFVQQIGAKAMAGVRQHILPRFLLKGFASKMDGQEAFTWVCRKGGNVFEANIKNVAVEKHFYTGPGEINVDDEITEIERGFALLLDEFRQEDHGFEVTNPGLPEFVVHLSSRTKHLRDSFIDMTGAMTSILSDYLADERKCPGLVAGLLQETP
jgi:hypothetical protein